MRIIREVRNVLDGPYRALEDNDRAEKKKAAANFRGEESRVVRKLLDLGLAIPKKSGADQSKRG